MIDVVIIGAGQSGLAMAYYLKNNQTKVLLIDKEDEIGASWLKRWDSLKLFTPVEFNNLPGFCYPGPKKYYPNKYEVAKYLKEYAQKFQFDIEHNLYVNKITKSDKCFSIYCNKEKTIHSRIVIIATGPFHTPSIPKFHTKAASEIFQCHSNLYKSPKSLTPGPTLIVGDGDSGFQILDEISKTGCKTYFSGNQNVKYFPQEILGRTLWWWFSKTGYLNISNNTWLGEKARRSKQPVIGSNVKSILNRKNVFSVGWTSDIDGQKIKTEKENLYDVKNIIWATGYKPNFKWIEGLDLDNMDYPKHHRGVCTIKNLYFIGLPWQNTRGSATLGGVKKDALYLSSYIQKHL